MALITCPNCGQQMSDRAEKCPHCGADPRFAQNVKPVTPPTKQANEGVKIGWVILSFLIPLVGLIQYFRKYPNPATAKAELIAAIVGFILTLLIQM